MGTDSVLRITVLVARFRVPRWTFMIGGFGHDSNYRQGLRSQPVQEWRALLTAHTCYHMRPSRSLQSSFSAGARCA